MTNPTDREEGAMSELGDKERRFVEDQRRIAIQPITGTAAADVEYVYEPSKDLYEELQTLKDHLDAAAKAEGDQWKSEMLAANATMLRMWLLEGSQEMKQKIRRQDALLDQAAEVLREFSDYEPQDREYGDHCLYCDEYTQHKKTCPLSRAKALLDKLGERE